MIRYFYNKVNRYYYGIVETNNHVLYIQDFLDEYPLETKFSANRILENPESIFVEVNKPDPDPLEERYINATDRPSVDDFKYPYLWLDGEWDDAISLIDQGELV